MNLHRRLNPLLAILLSLFAGTSAFASVPLFATMTQSADGKLIFFQDSIQPDHYWYMPGQIIPAPREDGTYAEPRISAGNFTYFYEGMVVYPAADLDAFARSKNVPIGNLTLIEQEFTSGMSCTDIGENALQFMGPKTVYTSSEPMFFGFHADASDAVEVMKQVVNHANDEKCYLSVSVFGLKEGSSTVELQAFDVQMMFKH